MDITFNILLFIHLVALVVAAATNVAMPLVGAQMNRVPPEARANLGLIARRLSMNARAGLAVLVVSGVALLWVRYGGVEGQSAWFWAKMVLVGVAIVLSIVGMIVPPARLNPRIFGGIARAILLGIIFTAIFAFN